jgi:phage recombination protein Bet
MSNAIVTQAQAKQFQLSQDKIDLIKRTICKNASNDELAFFIEQCDRTGLDPFARQIYSIRRKQWNSTTRQSEEAQVIQVSIDGFRLIADRSNKYAGQVGPWWCDKDGEWREVWLADEPPAAAKAGVLRSDFQQPAYGIALYKSYVQTNSQGDPVSRWKTDPAGMLAKCAESLALRRAFPQELSGLYTTEEMTQADKEEAAINTAWKPADTLVETTTETDRVKVVYDPATVSEKIVREPVKAEPVQPAAIGKPTGDQIIEHLVAMTELPRNRVSSTLKYCDLIIGTHGFKAYECWWEQYKDARADNLTPVEAGKYANLRAGSNPDHKAADDYYESVTVHNETLDQMTEGGSLALDGTPLGAK